MVAHTQAEPGMTQLCQTVELEPEQSWKPGGLWLECGEMLSCFLANPDFIGRSGKLLADLSL